MSELRSLDNRLKLIEVRNIDLKGRSMGSSKRSENNTDFVTRRELFQIQENLYDKTNHQLKESLNKIPKYEEKLYFKYKFSEIQTYLYLYFLNSVNSWTAWRRQLNTARKFSSKEYEVEELAPIKNSPRYLIFAHNIKDSPLEKVYHKDVDVTGTFTPTPSQIFKYTFQGVERTYLPYISKTTVQWSGENVRFVRKVNDDV